MKPLIVVNLKAYDTGTGDRALELAKQANELVEKYGARIIFAVQPSDIYNISRSVSFPIYAQHIDPIDFGAHTGWILPEAIKDAGASGTILNHAERKIPMKDLEKSITYAKGIGLETIVCADTLKEAKAIAAFEPNYIAVEPPELIGGDISVSTARPEIISEAVKFVKKINKTIGVLVGAGVKNGTDVRKALELGAEGVLLASGVTKSKEPKKALKDLACV